MKRVLALLAFLTFACGAGVIYDPMLSQLVTDQSSGTSTPSYTGVTITDAGTLVFYDDGDDTTVTFGPVGDGTTILGVTGTINATGLQVGGAAVLTAEADTLDTVAGRGATTDVALSVTAASALTLGLDAATNTAGYVKFWGAGANDFGTTITAGEQTQDVAYTLPLNDGDSGQFLKTDGAGALSWAAAGGGAEADTLATVTARGATSADSLTLTGATPLALGEDKAGGNANTAGAIKLFSAGDNAYSSTFTAGTQTADAAYTLPVNDGDAKQALVTNGSGALSWTHTVNTYSAPVALTYAADCTPDCADGLLRKCTLTGNIEINPPSNPAEGMRWECWLTCDGSARTLTLDAAILVPSESTVSWPKTLVASKTFIVMLKYNGSAWMLASLVGAY